MSNVWSSYSQNWHHLGPPQRPSEGDGRAMLALASPVLAGRQGEATVAVLGVTPEVVGLSWPGARKIHALDHNAEMVKTVWRPHATIPSEVTLTRWQEMPFADASVDVAAGDGSLNSLPAPQDYRDVLGEVARVLRPGGALILRCYIRPSEPEDLDAVVADALGGRIGSFHVLRWRIAMSLKRDDMTVAVTEIHDAFSRHFPDRPRLSEATGWPLPAIDTIDAYAGADTRYTFPTRGELLEVFAPLFQPDDEKRSDYELAERCPTIRFRLANGA